MALWLLTTVFNEARNQLREQEKAVLATRLDYLAKRLGEVSVIEHRNVLLNLLASNSRREMLLHGDTSVAARVIEDAYVSKYKTEPNLVSMVAFPAVLGFVVSAVVIFLLIVLRHE